jgi:CcmD family protein
MGNMDYLCAAYSIIFAAIFLYVMFLWRKQAGLDTKLRGLENEMREVHQELAMRLPPSRSAS